MGSFAAFNFFQQFCLMLGRFIGIYVREIPCFLKTDQTGQSDRSRFRFGSTNWTEKGSNRYQIA